MKTAVQKVTIKDSRLGRKEVDIRDENGNFKSNFFKNLAKSKCITYIPPLLTIELFNELKEQKRLNKELMDKLEKVESNKAETSKCMNEPEELTGANLANHLKALSNITEAREQNKSSEVSKQKLLEALEIENAELCIELEKQDRMVHKMSTSASIAEKALSLLDPDLNYNELSPEERKEAFFNMQRLLNIIEESMAITF